MDKLLQIRIDATEKVLWEAMAELSGASSVSDWIRTLAREAQKNMDFNRLEHIQREKLNAKFAKAKQAYAEQAELCSRQSNPLPSHKPPPDWMLPPELNPYLKNMKNLEKPKYNLTQAEQAQWEAGHFQ